MVIFLNDAVTQTIIALFVILAIVAIALFLLFVFKKKGIGRGEDLGLEEFENFGEEPKKKKLLDFSHLEDEDVDDNEEPFDSLEVLEFEEEVMFSENSFPYLQENYDFLEGSVPELETLTIAGDLTEKSDPTDDFSSPNRNTEPQEVLPVRTENLNAEKDDSPFVVNEEKFNTSITSFELEPEQPIRSQTVTENKSPILPPPPPPKRSR